MGIKISELVERPTLNGDEYTVIQLGNRNYKARLKAFKGEKGDTFTYDDLTPEQFMTLLRPMGKIEVIDRTSFTIKPNILYWFDWSDRRYALSLSLHFEPGADSTCNEYLFAFKTNDRDDFTLSLPDTVRFREPPLLYRNTTYMFSIIDNLAVMGGWADE